MKLVDFKNKHKDNDIYIIASGKSLDFIEPNFFNNKITIGINQVYKKVNTKYLIRKEMALSEQVINNNKNKTIFISRGNCGNKCNSNRELQEKKKI